MAATAMTVEFGTIHHHVKRVLKGHWTTSAHPPFFPQKVEIFIPLQVYT